MSNIKFTFPRTIHKPIVTLHDFPLQSGYPTNPTDESASTILNFGSYFTGNGTTVDTDVAHTDILFYWDCESSSANIATGSDTITLYNSPSLATGVVGDAYEYTGTKYAKFSGTSNISNTGSISFWHKTTGTPITYSRFLATSSATAFQIYRNSDSQIHFEMGASSCTVNLDMSINIFDGSWHHLKFSYDGGSGIVTLYVDGQEMDSGTSSSGTFTAFSGDIYVGNRATEDRPLGGIIDQLFITNNPNTPEIPTVAGVPLHMPILKVT